MKPIINPKTMPYARVQQEDSLIEVSNAVLRLIGKPNSILFLYNNKKNSLIVQPAEINDPNGWEVENRLYEKNRSFFISSFQYVNQIFDLADNWKSSCSYVVPAKYYELDNLAMFDMNEDAIADEILCMDDEF
jgi:hypothetical protein